MATPMFPVVIFFLSTLVNVQASASSSIYINPNDVWASSSYWSNEHKLAKPSLAVDGNFNANYSGRSVYSSALGDSTPQYDIYLGGTYVVESVTITNRDSSEQRLHDIYVYVYERDPKVINQPPPMFCNSIGSVAPAASSNTTLVCTGNPVGRYIRIMKNVTQDIADLMHFAEVVVEGYCYCFYHPLILSDVYASSVFQYNSGMLAVAARAVDGNYDPMFSGGSVFSTEIGDRYPFFDIHMGDLFLVQHVTITNTLDSYERLHHIEILVYRYNPVVSDEIPTLCHSIGNVPPAAGSTTTYYCTGYPIGRYIRLMKTVTDSDTDLLTFAEVSVEVSHNCNNHHIRWY